MRIKEFTIDNFKVFQRSTTIDFTKNGDKNIYLIGGANGSGKTSILEALNFCLYGGKNKDIFEKINKNEIKKGNCKVSFKVVFEKDDGEELEVKRIWKASEILTNDPKPEDLEEKLVIKKEGKKFKAVDKSSWQEFINTTIPEGISNFFFFDGEKIERMAEDKGSSLRLKSSIETILGLKTPRKLIEDLDQVERKIKKDSSDVSNTQIKKEQADLDLLQEELGNLQKERKRLESDIEKIKEKKNEIRDQFHERFGFSPEARNKLNNLKKKRNSLKVDLSEINKTIKKYCNNTLPLVLLFDKFSQVKKQISLEEDIKQKKALKQEREQLSRKIIDTIYKSNNCPVGGESVDDKEKEELVNKISKSIYEDISDNEDIILDMSNSQVQNFNSILKSIKQSSAKNIIPLLKKRTNIQQRIEKIKENISKLELQEGNKEDFEAMEERLFNQENALGRKKENLNQIEEEIFSKKDQIEKKNKDIEELYKKFEETKTTKKLTNKVGQVQGALEEYIKILREQKLEDLKKNIFSMYEKLAYKSDLMEDIRIGPNNYNVSIINKEGREIEKKNLSAGEKEIYAISLLWGLAETSSYNLPIIIDTPLARLDKTHRSSIIDNYLPEAGEQVVVLSTDTEINEEYYNKLKPDIANSFHLNFDKGRIWSTIEEGYFWD